MKNIVNPNLIALLSPSFLRVGLKSVNRMVVRIIPEIIIINDISKIPNLRTNTPKNDIELIIIINDTE